MNLVLQVSSRSIFSKYLNLNVVYWDKIGVDGSFILVLPPHFVPDIGYYCDSDPGLFSHILLTLVSNVCIECYSDECVFDYCSIGYSGRCLV